MKSRSFSFTHAIVRRPGRSVVDGLRAVETGAPDFELFVQHHRDYVAALRSAGANVIELEAMEAFPDAVFIEDAALCLPEGAVVMRPGAPTRLGEAAELAPVLEALYAEVAAVEAPGFIEGGDVLVTETEILVGRSARTTTEGINALRQITGVWGYRVREVVTPPGVLHFKTDCSLLDAETVLATPRLAASGCFDGYEVIHTAPGEDACANSIRFNEQVIMPAGYSATAEVLRASGYEVTEIGNSEAAKLDGGMSCLSLRCSPPVTGDR